VIALLDVNLLVALAWPNHVHHDLAHSWFAAHREQGWATCPLTQSSFVRVSSNRRVVPTATSPAEARALLRGIVALSGHVFWLDDVRFVDSELIDETRLAVHRQVTDVHLLAIARRHGGCLATLDRGVRDLVAQDVNDVVCLVSSG
jgi:hypothetical protein